MATYRNLDLRVLPTDSEQGRRAGRRPNFSAVTVIQTDTAEKKERRRTDVQ
jgi:hypothetical protein